MFFDEVVVSFSSNLRPSLVHVCSISTILYTYILYSTDQHIVLVYLIRYISNRWYYFIHSKYVVWQLTALIKTICIYIMLKIYKESSAMLILHSAHVSDGWRESCVRTELTICNVVLRLAAEDTPSVSPSQYYVIECLCPMQTRKYWCCFLWWNGTLQEMLMITYGYSKCQPLSILHHWMFMRYTE